MTVVEPTDIVGKCQVTPRILSKRWFCQLGLFALTGFILILVNFPKFLTMLIKTNVANPTTQDALCVPIQFVGSVLSVLIGPNPIIFFERAMTCGFGLLWLYLLLLLVFSGRRRGIRMCVYGFGAIVLGYLALHLIAWAAVAVVITFKGAIFIVHWVGQGIAVIVAFVIQYTRPIMIFIAVGVVFYLSYHFRARFAHSLQWLLLMIKKYPIHLFGTAVVLCLLWLFIPSLYLWVILPVLNFLKWILVPVIYALVFLVKWIIIIVLATLFVGIVISSALLSLAILGSLLWSQLQAGWHAARSLRHVMIAGFAIGSALGLIVLVSVATPAVAASLNQAWINILAILHLTSTQTTTHFVTLSFELFLPQSVENFVFSKLTSLQAPVFDSFVFLAIMSLASISMLFRVFSTRPIDDEYISVPFVAWQYIKLVGGLFVSLILIFLSSTIEGKIE